MEQFTNMRPTENTEPKELYTGKHRKIVDIDGWEVTHGVADASIAIVYLEDTMEVVMRREYIPPYNFRDGSKQHLVCVAGGIEEGESPEEAMFRELFEETGIVTKTSYDRFTKLRTLYSNKASTIQCHIYFVPLRNYEFDEVEATGDGSKYEAQSDSVKIHISHLNTIQPSDVLSTLCIELLKNELSLKA